MRAVMLAGFVAVVPGLPGCGEDWGNIPPPDRITEDTVDTTDVPEDESDVPSDGSEDESDASEDGSDAPDDGSDAPDACDATYYIDVFEPDALRAGLRSYVPVWTVQGSFNPDFAFPVTLLSVDSYPESGGPVIAGTYEITERVSTTDCGLCVFILENCPESVLTCETWYAADAGTLTLDTIEYTMGGRVQGSLTGAHLLEINWSTNEAVVDGSSYCLERWDFDAVIDWTVP